MRRKGRRPLSHDLSYGPAERRSYGVIATLVDTETGNVRVEHRGAPRTTLEAVQDIIALCDQLGPAWKVRTLSHPLSIHRDLINAGTHRAPQTESALLGRLGRMDLVEWASQATGIKTRATTDRKRKA